MLKVTEGDHHYTGLTVYKALSIVGDELCELSVRAGETMPIPIVYARGNRLLNVVDYRLEKAHCELTYYDNVHWFITIHYDDAHREVWE